ncbi:hypothetical protein BH11PLA2_BH11PLA2_23130 [soil metagenome]
MAKKKKDTWRQTFGSGKRETFKDWTIIQKAIGVIFIVGMILAIMDMSCGSKETPTAPTSSPSQTPKLSKD